MTKNSTTRRASRSVAVDLHLLRRLSSFLDRLQNDEDGCSFTYLELARLHSGCARILKADEIAQAVEAVLASQSPSTPPPVPATASGGLRLVQAPERLLSRAHG